MFAERLKLLRNEKKITQAELASLMKVGRPTIAGYETKGTQPDYEKLAWLASFFNVSTDYLLGLTDIKNGKHLSSNPALNMIKEEEFTYNVFGPDIEKVINYYKRLNDENKDYIKGQMIQLYKDQTNSASSKGRKGTG